MATKTINLTGAEVAVTGLDGAHAHIRNDGTEVIYAAKTAGITAGADGVASIPAGQSDTIRGISGAVYLLGTGSVLIQSDDYVASPFKTSAASGGSAVDEVARAAINTHAGNDEIHVTAEDKAKLNGVANEATRTLYSQILVDGVKLGELTINGSGPWGIYAPSSLPANGGNADTLDGLHESSFAQNIGVWNEGDIKDLLLACQKSGFVWIQPGVTGMPNDDTYWFGIADCHTVHRQLIVRDINNSASYCMRWNNGTQTWISWKNLADGGNAASVGTYTEAKIAALEARVAALEAKG